MARLCISNGTCKLILVNNNYFNNILMVVVLQKRIINDIIANLCFLVFMSIDGHKFTLCVTP